VIDVLAIALTLVAVTLLLDPGLPRASLIGTAVWLGATAALVPRHGVFPGISYGVAILTGALSFAILAAPVAPRVLRFVRGVAASAALAAAIGGFFHG
jgi:hypothetical protein